MHLNFFFNMPHACSWENAPLNVRAPTTAARRPDIVGRQSDTVERAANQSLAERAPSVIGPTYVVVIFLCH